MMAIVDVLFAKATAWICLPLLRSGVVNAVNSCGLAVFVSTMLTRDSPENSFSATDTYLLDALKPATHYGVTYRCFG